MVHLRKAALRSLQRPLSALSTNLSKSLLRLISSPDFLNPPAPTIHAPNPNPTQAHALGLATVTGELLEVFDEPGLGLDSDARGDGLKLTGEALLFVATRVIYPLVAGIKAELASLIEALEAPAPTCTSSCYTFKDGQHAASFHSRSPRHHTIYARALTRYLLYYLYPVSSCIVGDFCGLARTRGPCSRDTFTPEAAMLAKSRTLA